MKWSRTPAGGDTHHGPRARDGSHRPTLARRAVAQLVCSGEECLTVEQIHTRLREQGRTIGLATLYRTVNLLSETGAIQRIDAGDGVSRFEAPERGPEDHHHHLICRSCHRVIRYAQFSQEELDLMRRTERTLEQRFGYRIAGHRIYFEGLCPACQDAQ